VPVGAAMSRPLWGLRGWSLMNRRRPKPLEKRPRAGTVKSKSGRVSVHVASASRMRARSASMRFRSSGPGAHQAFLVDGDAAFAVLTVLHREPVPGTTTVRPRDLDAVITGLQRQRQPHHRLPAALGGHYRHPLVIETGPWRALGLPQAQDRHTPGRRQFRRQGVEQGGPEEDQNRAAMHAWCHAITARAEPRRARSFFNQNT
jgi:hypothetical protein